MFHIFSPLFDFLVFLCYNNSRKKITKKEILIMRYFLNSILAGIFIAIAAIANLTVGGFAGACIFAVGLIMILQMKFNLFTGEISMLLNKQVSIPQLELIYVGNLIGILIVALMFIVFPNALTTKAQAIVEIRNANGFFLNAMRGMLCGLLVRCAHVDSCWMSSDSCCKSRSKTLSKFEHQLKFFAQPFSLLQKHLQFLQNFSILSGFFTPETII